MCSALSDSLRPHGLQHCRLPCPSPSPRVCSNSIESVMPPNHLTLCRPLLLLPSIFPSIRVFSRESALCIRWPKCWSLAFLRTQALRTPDLFQTPAEKLLSTESVLPVAPNNLPNALVMKLHFSICLHC